MTPSRKNKSVKFYKKLNAHLEAKAKEIKSLSIYSIDLLENQHELMNQEEIDELIRVATAEKTYLAEPRFGNFTAVITVIITIMVFFFDIISDLTLAVVGGLYFLFILSAVLFMYFYDNSRSKKLRSITYYLETLKSIKKNKSDNL